MKRTAITVILIFICSFLSAVPRSTVETEKQYLNYAGYLFELGKYEQALRLYTTVRKLNPGNILAWVGVGNCDMMLERFNGAKQAYAIAKELYPDFTAPDLDKYRRMDKERGRNIDEIKKRYYDKFGKKTVETWEKKKLEEAEQPFKTLAEAQSATGLPPMPSQEDMAGQSLSFTASDTATPLPEASVSTAADAAKPAAVSKQEAPQEQVTSEDAIGVREKKLWSYRGGMAKTTSLGGLKMIIPDMTTALDGAAFGLDSGFLFRPKQHVFNLSPCYGYYDRSDTADNTMNAHSSFKTMLASISDSIGELNWSSDYFLNRFRPFFTNSYQVNVQDPGYVAGTPGRDLKNSGNFAGGLVTIGFKPVALIGAAGSVGIFYAPYTDYFNMQDALGNTISISRTMESSEIIWRLSAGIYLPGIFRIDDEFDVNAGTGTFNPELELGDIRNNRLFRMPFSLFHNYSMKIDDNRYYSLLAGFHYEDSSTLDVSGNVMKANVHYMIGDSLHEIYCYAEYAPEITMKIQKESNFMQEGLAIPISTTVLSSTTVATEKTGALKTGFRDNFKYLTAGLRYDYDYRESDFNGTTLMSDFLPPAGESIYPNYSSRTGREIEKNHRFIAGVNITPIDMVSLPVEYEYNFYNLSADSVEKYCNDSCVRAGLQIKPTPFFALRGGVSYEYIRNETRMGGNIIDPGAPGTSSNPAINLTGYHLGAGLDMPLFEINIGASYKKIYRTPELSGTASSTTYYFLGFADLNIYI